MDYPSFSVGIKSKLQGNHPVTALRMRGYGRNTAQASSALCDLLASLKERCRESGNGGNLLEVFKQMRKRQCFLKSSLGVLVI